MVTASSREVVNLGSLISVQASPVQLQKREAAGQATEQALVSFALRPGEAPSALPPHSPPSCRSLKSETYVVRVLSVAVLVVEQRGALVGGGGC